MKTVKYILVLITTGVILTSSLYAQSPTLESFYRGAIEQVIDFNNDRDIEAVIFSIEKEPFAAREKVEFVEVFVNGKSWVIDKLRAIRCDMKSFYYIDLTPFGSPAEFELHIHLKAKGDPRNLMKSSLMMKATRFTPNDPDPTVIVLKYP